VPNVLAQNTTFVTYSGALSVSATFASALTNPSLIIAAATQENPTGTFSIADNANAGTYTKDQEIGASNTAENGRVVIARKQNTATSAATVTCTLGANSVGVLKIYELTGADTTNAYDSGAANGTDNTAHSITFTTVAANCSVISISFHYPAGAVVDAGYTAAFAEHTGSFGYHFGEHDVDVGAAGSITLTNGISASRDYFAFAAAAYKPASGAAELPIPDTSQTPSTYNDIVRDLVMRARRELVFALDSPPSLYASPGQSISVTQASETDTAQAVGKAKVKAIAQAVETDTSLAVIARKSKNLAQATETDTAQAVARSKSKGAAQATETDTAQAVARLKTKQVAQANETDLAQPITRSGAKNIAVLQATEVDTAQPVARSKAKTFAQALETDSAITVTRLKSRTLGIAAETDTAHSFAKAKVKAIGQAAETETALAITRLKRQTLQQATETNTAQAIARKKAKGVAQATETDSALPVTRFGVVSSYLRGTFKVYPALGVGSINVTPSIAGNISVKPAITGTINVN